LHRPAGTDPRRISAHANTNGRVRLRHVAGEPRWKHRASGETFEEHRAGEVAVVAASASGRFLHASTRPQGRPPPSPRTHRDAASTRARGRRGDAKAEAERQSFELAAKDHALSTARDLTDDLNAKLTEKERAFRHLCAAHEDLKASLRERTSGWEAERRFLRRGLL
jgi:hypothetical protein